MPFQSCRWPRLFLTLLMCSRSLRLFGLTCLKRSGVVDFPFAKWVYGCCIWCLALPNPCIRISSMRRAVCYGLAWGMASGMAKPRLYQARKSLFLYGGGLATPRLRCTILIAARIVAMVPLLIGWTRVYRPASQAHLLGCKTTYSYRTAGTRKFGGGDIVWRKWMDKDFGAKKFGEWIDRPDG